STAATAEDPPARAGTISTTARRTGTRARERARAVRGSMADRSITTTARPHPVKGAAAHVPRASRAFASCRRGPDNRRLERGTVAAGGLSPEQAADEARVVEKLGIRSARRHIFLCCDQAKPKCCDRDRSIVAWKYLKRRLIDLGLADAGVLRTKANCLRICENGPIAVVYPEGAWYRG